LSWQILKQTVLHDSSWLRLLLEHVRLPNGVEIEDFYRIEMTPYVMMFAVDRKGRVAMVEHYKHGPHQVSLELPAGYIEEDDPLETAKRELLEETGLASEDWMYLGKYFKDGNRGCGWVYGFLARNANPVGETHHEATEIMTIHFKPLDEVYNLWRSGEINNVSSLGIIGRSLLELGYLQKA
jgi:ADP-ribose pyrophosphatase